MPEKDPTRTYREGRLLLIAGILIAMFPLVQVMFELGFIGVSLPPFMVTSLLLLWLVWFIKWSSEGGMPRFA